MNENLPETYILAIPGSEDTQELPRQELRAKIAQGEITPAHWVWSPGHQDWKQVSEIPDLQTALPSSKQPFGLKTKSLPFFNPNAPSAETSAAPAAKKSSRKKSRTSSRSREKEESGFPFVSILFALLFLALAGIIGANYVLIDEPLEDNLAQTPFILVPIHAHLGGFVQPNALVIHVLPNSGITEDNFADLLFTLAKSTPTPPFNQKSFGVVELTSAWVGQYALTGTDWQTFAGMAQASAQDRKDFVLDHLADPTGKPLIIKSKDANPADLQTARDKIWDDLLAHFLSKQVDGQASQVTST